MSKKSDSASKPSLEEKIVVIEIKITIENVSNTTIAELFSNKYVKKLIVAQLKTILTTKNGIRDT